jgi:hypothetical protein
MELPPTGDRESLLSSPFLTSPRQIAEEKREEYVASQVSLGQDILSHIARQGTVSLKEERDLIAAESLEGLSLFSTMASPANDPSDTRGVAVSEVLLSLPLCPHSRSDLLHRRLSLLLALLVWVRPRCALEWHPLPLPSRTGRPAQL